MCVGCCLVRLAHVTIFIKKESHIKTHLTVRHCILNEICANNEQLFKVQPDEPFFCEHSQERYDAFRDLMLSMDT